MSAARVQTNNNEYSFHMWLKCHSSDNADTDIQLLFFNVSLTSIVHSLFELYLKIFWYDTSQPTNYLRYTYKEERSCYLLWLLIDDLDIIICRYIISITCLLRSCYCCCATAMCTLQIFSCQFILFLFLCVTNSTLSLPAIFSLAWIRYFTYTYFCVIQFSYFIFFCVVLLNLFCTLNL